MMIEQPLAHDDIIDHAVLQAALATPICLDECIRSAHQAEQAHSSKGRRHHQHQIGPSGRVCRSQACSRCLPGDNVPVWCGGMLESGIGRAHNIALSTLPNFVLPGDVSASKRYWKRDIIVPPVEVSSRGTIQVSDAPGFGYELDLDYLESLVVRRETLT